MSISFQHAGQRKSDSGFTLTELLVVVALIGILMAVTIPSLHLSRAGAVKQGIGNMVNLLTLSRAKAVSSHSSIYVVFADANNFSSNAGALPYRSYAVLQLTNRPTSTTANWIYIDRWRTLPEGSFFTNLTSLCGANSTVPFPTNGGSAANSINYIEFKASGALNNANDLTLTVLEGTVLGSTVRTANTNNQIVCEIHALTGKTKVIQ